MKRLHLVSQFLNYRKPFFVKEVVELIKNERGGQFDPYLVNSFEKSIYSIFTGLGKHT